MRKRLSTAPWIFGLLAFGVACCALGIALLNANDTSWVTWSLVALLFVFVAALLEAGFKRIEDRGDSILIVENFRQQYIAKKSVRRVSWEKGVGSYLELDDGTVTRLPTTGRNEQGVTNSIRSWLNGS